MSDDDTDKRCDFPEHLELLVDLATAVNALAELRPSYNVATRLVGTLQTRVEDLEAEVARLSEEEYHLHAEVEWQRSLIDAVGEDICKTALREKNRQRHGQSPDK